jgi:hypothetical protein
MLNPKVEAYLSATVRQVIAATARADVEDALRQVGQAAHFARSQALRALALRRYLRMQNRQGINIHSRWAWTPEQAKELSGTGKAKLLMEQAAKAQEAFLKSNPGYSLAVSPLRSVERQVELWNGNLSVNAAATQLFGLVLQKLDEADFELPATHVKVEKFATWLQNREVSPEPTSAAPGTSDHGQLRAVDFVVVRGRAVIAGTKTARIHAEWTATGWDKKLAEATTNTKLVGPLKHPYEPWHWRIA